MLLCIFISGHGEWEQPATCAFLLPGVLSFLSLPLGRLPAGKTQRHGSAILFLLLQWARHNSLVNALFDWIAYPEHTSLLYFTSLLPLGFHHPLFLETLDTLTKYHTDWKWNTLLYFQGQLRSMTAAIHNRFAPLHTNLREREFCATIEHTLFNSDHRLNPTGTGWRKTSLFEMQKQRHTF